MTIWEMMFCCILHVYKYLAFSALLQFTGQQEGHTDSNHPFQGLVPILEQIHKRWQLKQKCMKTKMCVFVSSKIS